MTAAMTDAERALWAAAQSDYTHALKIADKAWRDAMPSEIIPGDAVIQAAAATILIHVTKLRSEERIHVRVPQSPAPAAVKRDLAAAFDATRPQAPVAVPPCKKCGGAMSDVRADKRSDKQPDFVCRQEKGDCGKPNKDKTKWFATAQWIEKPAANGGNVRPNPLVGQTAPASFENRPEALDEEDSGLPF